MMHLPNQRQLKLRSDDRWKQGSPSDSPVSGSFLLPVAINPGHLPIPTSKKPDKLRLPEKHLKTNQYFRRIPQLLRYFKQGASRDYRALTQIEPPVSLLWILRDSGTSSAIRKRENKRPQPVEPPGTPPLNDHLPGERLLDQDRMFRRHDFKPTNHERTHCGIQTGNAPGIETR